MLELSHTTLPAPLVAWFVLSSSFLLSVWGHSRGLGFDNFMFTTFNFRTADLLFFPDCHCWFPMDGPLLIILDATRTSFVPFCDPLGSYRPLYSLPTSFCLLRLLEASVSFFFLSFDLRAGCFTVFPGPVICESYGQCVLSSIVIRSVREVCLYRCLLSVGHFGIQRGYSGFFLGNFCLFLLQLSCRDRDTSPPGFGRILPPFIPFFCLRTTSRATCVLPRLFFFSLP